MRVTFDTNIWVYTVDQRDLHKSRAAQTLVLAANEKDVFVGIQCCGEFYNACTRRLGKPRWEAAQAARNLAVSFPSFTTQLASIQTALGEAAAGRFSFRDANLLAAAEAAGCTHMISEDMADGARLGRIEVVAPFGPSGVSDRARILLSIEEA